MSHSYALVGKHLAHSFSKIYFEKKFLRLGLTDASYCLIEMPTIQSIRDSVERLRLDGFNVTIPYKEQIIPLLDGIDPTAADIGAVNTVKVVRQYGCKAFRLIGHNTDAPAFLETLQPLLAYGNKQCLVLGTGGASKAVAWALRQLDIAFHFVSRNPKQDSISFQEAYNISSCHSDNQLIIINATPVGMFPDTDASPWQHPELITPQCLCYDLVYNPSPTLFLSQASGRGAVVCDGLKMLHRQADLAFEIWTL